MNANEESIKKKYEGRGYKAMRGGAPDFVFFKNNNGGISDVIFVEVKNKKNSDKLSEKQEIHKKILENLGAKFRVEHGEFGPVTIGLTRYLAKLEEKGFDIKNSKQITTYIHTLIEKDLNTNEEQRINNLVGNELVGVDSDNP